MRRDFTPDFLILGAPKCGTTSLSNALNNHPRVYIPPIKEVGFFANDANWRKGVEWYEKYFENAEEGVLLGEATPTYLQAPEAPERIAHVCPEARLLVMVRDPVERARSHYWFRRRYGKEDRELQEAFWSEIDRYPDMGDEDYLIPPALYATNLERYVNTFEEEQIHVVSLCQLSSSPRLTLREVQHFVGLEPQPLDLPHENQSSAPRSYIYRDLVQKLVEYQGLTKKVIKFVTTRSLRRRVMDFMHKVNMEKKPKPDIPNTIKYELYNILKSEVKITEKVFGVGLKSEWKNGASHGS
jgi:hypothetical protein